VAFPTFVGAGTLVESTTGVAITPVPNASHASGDYELCVIETQDQAVTLATAAGFTQHPGSPVSAPSGTATLATRLTVFERIWNGTDGSPVSDTTARNHTIGVVLSFRRSSGTWATLADARSATQGTGWETSHEEVDDTTGEWPGLTTDTADQLIVGVTAHAKPDIAGGTAEMSAITNANLATITERFDDAAASGNGGWIGAFTGEEATSGQAIGVTTYTKATISFKAHMTIALRDSPPGGAVGPPTLRRPLPHHALMSHDPWAMGGWA
jgi:hypothetical protein